VKKVYSIQHLVLTKFSMNHQVWLLAVQETVSLSFLSIT